MPPKRAKATRASIHEDTVEAQTPEQSPAKTMTGITEAQKQALVDNLQLEITERARKLRAQYAMQAQGLRTRLEMRVNRIPQGLRKRNIQDLLDEHAQREKPQPAPPVPASNTEPAKAPVVPSKSPLRKSLKRQSDHISTADDKENAELPPNDLPNPKKRTKTATTAANTKPASRTASRKVPAPPGILSPRSHNSRTLPKSPIKPTGEKEPSKFLSPTKATTTTVASGLGSRAPSRAQQQQPNSKRPVSRTSIATTRRSAGSTGTTIVKSSSTASQNQAPAPAPVVKKGPGRPATATAKQSAVSTAAAKTAAAAGVGGKKGAAAKKENLAPGAATAGTGGTGRTLRKRG
ncbi:hypothetical protein KC340_g14193 [Hortaea werneckii]|nr:hypothetical protein KC342_g13686 [Hortaea werneckii]KAI7069761.1 hypothetical protein KC339_g14759 [Hortaea werneckii]KAI7217455.1 hypothetical protein KC365_g12932 [Hortaea werneckii]KAI7298698.1 hypothetical protein KC340_g14193 [Hortaea werneckii]KAI7378290.1 hypothetical protein KC328_g13969 [Hortaea werneckii]